MCKDEWIAKQTALLEQYARYFIDGESSTKGEAVDAIKQNAEYLFGNYPMEALINCKYIVLRH